MPLLNIRNLVSGIGVLLGVVIAIAGPLGYWVIGAADSANALEFKARLSAGRAAKYVFLNERLWQYQVIRLAELIQYPDGVEDRPRQRIVDLSGKLVLQEAGDLLAPIQRIRVPVTVAGETIAWLDAEHSLRPLAASTGYVAASSLLLALLTWLTVRLLPLRVLDQTLLKLSTESARFQAALDNMVQGLCLFDSENRLVVHNRRFATMFATPALSVASSAMLPGMGLGAMFVPPDAARNDGRSEAIHELADGRVIQVSCAAIAGRGGWVATYEDITERRHSQELLFHMARHDALTGLPNRLMLREHMDLVLPRLHRSGSVAVLCLDLDRFKTVNDLLGHGGGDELLRLVARRLSDCIRLTDLVARLGGDEFAIVQVDPNGPKDVALLAERVIATIRAPFDIHGESVEIGTSIGAVLANKDISTPDELLSTADIALYRAKSEARGTYRFFEPEMDAEIQKRRRLEADLKRALAEQQFVVFYQPLISARTLELVGFEALVRWQHPERGLIMPADFIQTAEETGLIKAIGAWVLNRACSDAIGWPNKLKVSVNLSSTQFIGNHLVDDVEKALTLSGLDPHRLELEITESVLLHDNAVTLGILHKLRDKGLCISMDDFGTGYSSISYLRLFPFDQIKIDQSFIRDLKSKKGGLEIVRAVVGLGKALGMEVIAEGVETAEQLSIVRDEGCDVIQGYLFGKPQPLKDLPGIIVEHFAAPPVPAP